MQPREYHSNATVLRGLKPGVSLASADSEMNSIAAHLGEAHPKIDSGVGVSPMDRRQYLMVALRDE